LPRQATNRQENKRTIVALAHSSHNIEIRAKWNIAVVEGEEDMDIEANKALVRRYIEMWNTGNVELANDVLSPTWVDHAHPEVTSPEGVKQAVHERRAAHPGLHITIESILSEGNMVALRGTILRAQQGKEVISRAMWFVRIADGKMAEMWTGSETPG
jgi:predicted SnoaL-like aldol condensation-catalyzing enzyme